MTQGEAYWSVLEPAWNAVSIYDGAARFQREFATISTKACNLLAAHWCQSEVCNGGFHQFFTNSTGVLAPEAVEAFRVLGMPELARVVAQAMLWFGPLYPRDQSTRQAALSGFAAGDPKASSPFEQLDTSFYRLLDSESGGFYRAADEYALAANGA